jgi:protein-tyrosine phosphatase
MESWRGRLGHVVASSHGTWRGAVRTWLGEAEYVTGRLSPWLAPQPQAVSRLVFVCLGNINRSAYAAALARRAGAHCVSFGLSTTTGVPATDLALRTAAQRGLDLSAHRATDMTAHAPLPGDLVLAMEVRHARRLQAAGFAPPAVALLGHWGSPHRIHIHDPHTLSPAYFATCFTVLESAVGGLLGWLAAGGSPAVRAPGGGAGGGA